MSLSQVGACLLGPPDLAHPDTCQGRTGAWLGQEGKSLLAVPSSDPGVHSRQRQEEEGHLLVLPPVSGRHKGALALTGFLPTPQPVWSILPGLLGPQCPVLGLAQGLAPVLHSAVGGLA